MSARPIAIGRLVRYASLSLITGATAGEADRANIKTKVLAGLCQAAITSRHSQMLLLRKHKIQ
jgi:hypothetical protein